MKTLSKHRQKLLKKPYKGEQSVAIKIVDSDFQSILSVALSSKFGHSFPKQICISVNFVQIFKNSYTQTKKYPHHRDFRSCFLTRLVDLSTEGLILQKKWY